MRLDHLLSKERLPARWVWVSLLDGGDTGELSVGCGRRVGTAPVVGCGRRGGWGWWLVLAPCWVLKEQPGPVLRRSGSCGGCRRVVVVSVCQAWPGPHTGWAVGLLGLVVRGLVGAVGLWVGCWLRIA